MSQEDVDDVAAQPTQTPAPKRTCIMMDITQYKRLSDLLWCIYPNDENKLEENKQSYIDKIISYGLARLEQETATSSTLLYNGKPPRKDVRNRLCDIVLELKKLQQYPNINYLSIKPIVKDVIPQKDERTIRKYVDCIRDFCLPLNMCDSRRTKRGSFFLNITRFVDVVLNEQK